MAGRAVARHLRLHDHGRGDRLTPVRLAATGLPGVDLFVDRFAEVRAEAAKKMPQLADLQFRDLCRTFGVLARAGGAERSDVGDVLGNSAAVDPRLGETTCRRPSRRRAGQCGRSKDRPSMGSGHFRVSAAVEGQMEPPTHRPYTAEKPSLSTPK